jgi:hypothetical protein
MSKLRIIVEYVVDNDNWTEQEFEDNQDIERTFHITEEMLMDLIQQNVELEEGNFVSMISRITKN